MAPERPAKLFRCFSLQAPQCAGTRAIGEINKLTTNEENQEIHFVFIGRVLPEQFDQVK